MRFSGDHGLHGDLRYWPVPELVALDLPGGMGFVDALQAIWDTGDAAAPLDPRLPAARANRDARRACAPRGSSAPTGSSMHCADGLPVEDGDALVVATSGTSGMPKGVVLTHDAIAASARATSARLGIDPARHTWLACLPLAHIGGLSVVTRSIVTGTPVVVMPGFEAEAVEEAGRTGRATHVSLVTTALQRLDPSVFACVLLGGSKAPDALPPNVVSTYGMTETGSGVVYDGRPLEGVEVSFRPRPERAAEWTRRTRADGATWRRARSCSGPPCSSAATATGTTGASTVPTARRDWFATGDAGRLEADGKLVRLRPHRRRHHDGSGEGLARPASSASSAHTRASPRSPSGSGPIPSGASGWWPGSCPPTTLPRSRSSDRWWPRASPPGRPPRSWSSSTTCPARRRARSGGGRSSRYGP